MLNVSYNLLKMFMYMITIDHITITTDCIQLEMRAGKWYYQPTDSKI